MYCGCTMPTDPVGTISGADLVAVGDEADFEVVAALAIRTSLAGFMKRPQADQANRRHVRGTMLALMTRCRRNDIATVPTGDRHITRRQCILHVRHNVLFIDTIYCFSLRYKRIISARTTQG